MRKSYSDILEQQDIDFLESIQDYSRHSLRDPNNTIQKILSEISKDFDFAIKDESYWLIESRPSGHEWHKDTGSENHMQWCEVGCSMLLSGDFEGGKTLYREGEDVVAVTRNTYELLVHTSDLEHKVEPSSGKRKVLLLFI